MNTCVIKCGFVMGVGLLALVFSHGSAAQGRAAVATTVLTPGAPSAAQPVVHFTASSAAQPVGHSTASSAARPAMHPGVPSSALHALQNEWAVIQYTVPEPEKEARFATLADKARALTAAQEGRAETHLWEGIVLSSWGNAKGGPGALGIVKQARAQLETALAIDPEGYHGAAQMRLALLYARVPGWPIAFGDSKRAETLFKEALAIDADSIDINYFYADFLVQANRPAEARPLLERAAKAPTRPDQAMAENVRRKEIEALMRQLRFTPTGPAAARTQGNP